MKINLIISYTVISLSLLFNIGCYKGMALNEDRDKLMKAIEDEGPQVDGVEDTLLKGAIEATRNGEHQRAAHLYRQLLLSDETNTPYALGMAEAMRKSGDLDNAEIAYREIMLNEPKLIEAKEGYGLLRLSKGEFDKAGTLLSEVHAKEPKRWQTLNGLAIILIERGSFDDALIYFKEALKYKENNPSILNNIGLAYAINDEPENAMQALSKAIDETSVKSTQRKQIELNLALVLGVYGDMEAAEKILKQHLPPAAVANNLGLYAHLSNNDNLAKSYLNMALSRSPYHYKRAWENLETITKQTGANNAPPNQKTMKVGK
jgi:Flp pilus assembly protein TadD